MGVFDKVKKSDKEKKAKEDAISFNAFPFLKAIKPKERYVFHSDYFMVDNYYCSILSYFHTPGANDSFCPFWGINRIPTGLPPGVTTINFEQVKRMGESWIAQHQNTAEGVADMGENEHGRTGNNSSRNRASRARSDLAIIAQELNDGASYLSVHNRLLVKAPTLDALDDAIQKIERLYLDRFSTLRAAAYTGEQRRELSELFATNFRKKGKGFHYTSTEYAGSYSLVTHGMEDAGGEYVGTMMGDVNTSAVLFDINKYKHHVVIASEQYSEKRGRAHVSDMWGSKLSQACLINNGRVVHLILDDANLDKLGPKFTRLTSRIDMTQGDVNMFEMFGSQEDELSIFPTQMQKLVLMAEQAYETTDADRSIIRGSLEEVATKFYIENRMWYENAGKHRDKLRIVGIPHRQVPRLDMFVSYLDVEYKALVNASARDDERLHAMSVLRTTFKNLLSNNGDLFNTVTADSIDSAVHSNRVIYDFSNLRLRGDGIAMAQLVNILGFAVGTLGRNDLVVIHGAEHIDPSVREYVNKQFDKLHNKGGRVAYLYNNIDKMIDNQAFNHFDKADYVITGNMTPTTVVKYQDKIGHDIPADLERLITNKSNTISYIRRGFDNVVFRQDLQLDPIRKKKVVRGKVGR